MKLLITGEDLYESVADEFYDALELIEIPPDKVTMIYGSSKKSSFIAGTVDSLILVHKPKDLEKNEGYEKYPLRKISEVGITKQTFTSTHFYFTIDGDPKTISIMSVRKEAEKLCDFIFEACKKKRKIT